MMTVREDKGTSTHWGLNFSPIPGSHTMLPYLRVYSTTVWYNLVMQQGTICAV